jgi:hypothetical protein
VNTGPSSVASLNLQAIYDLRTAQEAVGKKIRALPTLNDRKAA